MPKVRTIENIHVEIKAISRGMGEKLWKMEQKVTYDIEV